MNASLRSSRSSYGDPRYLSTATLSDPHGPPSQSVAAGYRDEVHLHNDQAQYEPVRGNSETLEHPVATVSNTTALLTKGDGG